MEYLPYIYLFLTLTLLEVVLGIDNIVFLSILSNQLPPEKRAQTRFFGLCLALILRILFLLGASWLSKLHKPLFSFNDFVLTIHDVIFLLGGAYLLFHSFSEIRHDMKGKEKRHARIQAAQLSQKKNIFSIVVKMSFIDLVFSIDTVMTAIGMTRHVGTIVTAIFVSILVMLFFAHYVAHFIEKYSRIKNLALCFLLLIGGMLIAEGFHIIFDKAYLYAAIAFSLLVESINILAEHSKKRLSKG